LLRIGCHTVNLLSASSGPAGADPLQPPPFTPMFGTLQGAERATMTRSSTGYECRADAPADPPTGDLLHLTGALRDKARRSGRNVIVLAEEIAGRRAAAAAARPQAPLERWLAAQAQMTLRAVSGSARLDSPVAALELWAELTGRWLDANYTLAAALLGRSRS
jgi:hypothetical protein